MLNLSCAVRVVLILLMSHCCIASAQMYKWRGADGKILYSDSPPPSGVKSETLNIKNDPQANAQSDSQAAKDLKAKEANLSSQVDSRLRGEERARQDAEATRKNKESQCRRARERLKQAENMSVQRTERGLLIGNAEKQAAIMAATPDVQASCN